MIFAIRQQNSRNQFSRLDRRAGKLLPQSRLVELIWRETVFVKQ